MGFHVQFYKADATNQPFVKGTLQRVPLVGENITLNDLRYEVVSVEGDIEMLGDFVQESYSILVVPVAGERFTQQSLH